MTYGRNRQSIANIEQELNDIFDNHPKSQINANGEPVIPAENLLDVLQSFSELYNGQPLLSDEETSMLQELLAQNPGLEVTPQILLGFIAEKTKSAPSPDDEARGREEHRRDGDYSRTRSPSSDSDGTSYYPGNRSRPPSRGPMTPSIKSPLDSERRQRSTPLFTAPPSSWAKRPTPAGRRKSDAGSRSDGENGTPAWARSSSRRRTPSHPSSPTTPSHDLSSFSPGSPPDYARPLSRPQSRNTHHRGGGPFGGSPGSFDLGYSSPEDTNHTLKSPSMSRYGAFANEVSTFQMPRSTDNDSDEEDEVDASLVHDRTATSSTVSMEIHERMEALQRNNEELGRKLMEAERTLQNKLMEHETELEETHMRLEDLRSELSASNREEKELRAKDSRNMAQITALEAEIAKIQKALDSAKATYSSLQKQYQEQCAVSEKYRDDLRRRDETIRTLRENAALHEIETAKWQKEHDTYEERLAAVQAELNLALQAHTQLDEQKQENLLLKETIDRMRYEMDEMRNTAMNLNGLGIGPSGTSSAMNTLSKTLGAELMGKLRWDAENDEDDVNPGREDLGSDVSTAIDEEGEATEGEDEDVIQTIITKRKRKVASRAMEIASLRQTFEELKEYSDSSTQYDPTLFAVNHGMQTEPERKPLRSSFSIQTDPIPVPRSVTPPPNRITVEMEIQTEPVEKEPSRSPSPVHDESMASSSSTILPAGPPTPKPHNKALDPLDEPPAYNQLHAESADREWRLASEMLKKWHQGAHADVPFEFEGVPGGVSGDAVEDWKALKQELGVECGVIDKIVSASTVNTTSGSSSSSRREGKAPHRRSGRFYNIYNTYVYGAGGSGDKGPNSWSFSGLTSQALMFVGASALVLIAISPYMAPHSIGSVPGGATYYDRAAWHSFNSIQAAGEGWAGGGGVAQDGTAAVWNFLGRVGGGAARMARGFPT